MLHCKMISVVKCERASTGGLGFVEAVKDVISHTINYIYETYIDGEPKR